LVSILLGLAVTFITGNTIRLELYDRRHEVYISKLVGATNGFIQRPFLYSGFWLGFISGFLAWLIISGMFLLIESPVEELSILYNGSFQLRYLGFFEFLILMLSTSGLAVMGSLGVLHYQLRHLKPQ
jgi:cell division transport system permease protein